MMSYHNQLIRCAFQIYNCLWRLAIPLLKKNPRLLEGFGQRALSGVSPKSADLWVQAASGGEAYLAWSLLKHLRPSRPIRVLVTTNTKQGMEIIDRAIGDTQIHKHIKASSSYFPFDKPDIMEKAVKAVNPKVAVLLETEIWPALLRALKTNQCKIAIVNGRIKSKNWQRYRLRR